MSDQTRLRLLGVFFVLGPSTGKALDWTPSAMIGESMIIAAICFATALVVERLPPRG